MLTKSQFLKQSIHTVALPENNYLFKVNNRNIRKRCEICSKLTIKTPERRQQQLGLSNYIPETILLRAAKIPSKNN